MSYSEVSEIELFECPVAKLLITKKYYVPTVSNIYCSDNKPVAVYGKFSKIPSSTSVLFAIQLKAWRVACLRSSRLILYVHTYFHAGKSHRLCDRVVRLAYPLFFRPLYPTP